MASDATQDLKTHIDNPHDFYDLLSVPESAQEPEIRRAYRKTALKYHPDKLTTSKLPEGVTSKEEALEKFHLLQIAYDVLSDPGIKELYDNARRARQAKVEREKAFEGRRKWMKDDLERRENGALKRRRQEVDAEEAFERELRRLAEDGKRRRVEREEILRREAEQMEREEEADLHNGAAVTNSMNGNGVVPDIDRSITLRFPQNETTSHIDKAVITSRLSRFGPVEDAVLRDKKIKVDGAKHRRLYSTAVIVFKSVVGAYAAILDLPRLAKSETELYGVFEAVAWASGAEPEFIPKESATSRFVEPQTNISPRVSDQNGTINETASKKAPSSGSFKGTPAAATASPSLDEMTMIRLKNAERRRMEEKIRREEAEAVVAEADG